MTRRFWVGVLFFVLSTPLFAQERFTIAESLFIPPSYYVGDEVELRLTVLPASPMTVVRTGDLPSLPWVEIRGVEIAYTEPYYLVTIRFVSFASGTKTRPKLILGDLVLDNLRIQNASQAHPGRPRVG